MIISFTVENWMSFHEPATLSMVASKERQHGKRVPRLNKYKTKVLPIAAIYGGNASGKTNLFKALNFVKTLIVKGMQPDAQIPVEPFRLNAQGTGQPSRFRIELLIDEIIYELSFTVTNNAVLEEKLVIIHGSDEKTLYNRYEGDIEFDQSMKGEDDFLKFAFKGTRDNQLFLTNSVSQKITTFRPVYDWFKYNLELIAPDSRFAPFEQFFDANNYLRSAMNEMLAQLDTGIARIGGETFSLENSGLPVYTLKEEVKEGFAIRFSGPNDERVHVTRKDGNLIATKLVAYHPKSDGQDIKFEFNQESDGSKRVIDLLPAFLTLSQADSKKVYVIDELDRSLHTLLTRKLLELYLSNCSEASRSQLLFTTHDVLQMDQNLLRRDEMWVAEHDQSGGSTLFSFSDYKDIRYDKDIRKSYLQGRLGGIPRILLSGGLLNPCLAKKSKDSD